MKGCPSCGEENADRARFCQRCATPLEGPEERSAEVRKVVTIVFSDVSGSTSLGERLDPEALRRVMGRYFDDMSAVIERHGGTVEKFIGDAVMAVFGIPRLHEDDALRAVRAAAGMRQALETLNTELQRDHGVGMAARIGVNTGEVVAGDPSAGQRLVTGDAVNVAAPRAGRRTRTDPSRRHHLSPGQGRRRGGSGRDPRAEGQGRAGLRVPAGHPAGRYRRARAAPRLADGRTVQGARDAGASARPRGRGAHVASVHAPRAGRGGEVEAGARVPRGAGGAGDDPSRPVSVVRRRHHVLPPHRDRPAGGGRLPDRRHHHGPREARSARRGFRGWGTDRPARRRPRAWADPAATEEAFWGVRKLLEYLGRERPVVAVVDDIHWAEPMFLDLIEHLADWTRDAALLLVCLARPELLEVRPGWAGGKLNATSILLEPLQAEAASSLVDNLLGAAEIPVAARQRILEAAEGNPLFVEEMLGMLIDDGLLRFEEGAWRAVEDLAQVTVPATIQLLLAARLDRLDGEERAVIERGAIEGKVFHTGAVTTLSPEALRPRVPSRLLALARKELIRPDPAEFAGEDAFRFRHLLIRDAAYHAMAKELRADLHERFAAWLEHAAGERLPEYEEILGHHLEQACRYRTELGPTDDRTKELGLEAAKRLTSSAERAHERGRAAGVADAVGDRRWAHR